MNKSGQPTGTMPGWMTKLLSNQGQMVRVDAETIRRVDIMCPRNAYLIRTLVFQALFSGNLPRFISLLCQFVRICTDKFKQDFPLSGIPPTALARIYTNLP
jgi:hypothetical protein